MAASREQCPWCEVRYYDVNRFDHCYWCHRILTEDFWDALSDYLEQDPDRSGNSMFEAAERMVAAGLIDEPIDTVRRPQQEPVASVDPARLRPPPVIPRWVIVFSLSVLGLVLLLIVVAVAMPLTPGSGERGETVQDQPAPTAIPTVTPEATVVDFGAMAWADVVRLYEKSQGDNPTSLYEDALLSLNQGDITGTEVLATVEGSMSFTTYCAMSMAWMHREAGGYDDPVLERLAVLLVSRWPAKDGQDCIDDLDWSALTGDRLTTP